MSEPAQRLATRGAPSTAAGFPLAPTATTSISLFAAADTTRTHACARCCTHGEGVHACDPNSPQLNPIAQRRATYARSLLPLALGVQGVGAAGKEQVVGGVQQLAHHHVVRQPAGALRVKLQVGWVGG